LTYDWRPIRLWRGQARLEVALPSGSYRLTSGRGMTVTQPFEVGGQPITVKLEAGAPALPK
jgi:hypothetical protein